MQVRGYVEMDSIDKGRVAEGWRYRIIGVG